jgi:hypothetical protein
MLANVNVVCRGEGYPQGHFGPIGTFLMKWPRRSLGGRLAGPRSPGMSAEQIALRIDLGQPDQDTNFFGDAIPNRLNGKLCRAFC